MKISQGLATGLALALTAALAACHEVGDVKVTSLVFRGNKAIASSRLREILATQASSRLPFSAKHYFDRSQFDADLKRLAAFYADRGYPHARLANVDVTFNAAHDAVALTLTIDEGEPLIVEDLRTQGVDVLPAPAQAQLSGLPLAKGQPLDRQLALATREAVTKLLRDNGYAHAATTMTEMPGSGPNTVIVTVDATPGATSYFGDVSVAGLEQVSEHVVRRELAFKTGDLYRETLVRRSQRRISGLQLFQFVNVEPRTQDVPADGPTIPMRLTVAETKPQQWTLSGGYGSEERLRGSAQWKHLNFLGGARQATLDTKWSRLDRGAKVSLLQPYFLRPGLTLSVNGGTWWTYDLDYQSHTFGGRATLAYTFDSRLASTRTPIRDELRLTFVHEYLRYGVTQSSLTDFSRRDRLIALGLNPDTGQGSGTLAAIDFDAQRTSVNDPVDPHRGYAASLHLQQAAPWFGRGTYRYHEVMADSRGYLPFGSITFAARARVGAIFTATAESFPFSERYFLGGSTTLRGWGRYQVSPLNEDGLPVGGRSQAFASAEIRFPISGPLSGVAFVDAGTVSPTSHLDWSTLRYDIGPGLRYQTKIGQIRTDVGYQLNPIPGLLILGQPQTRRWRIHFSIGQAF